MMLSPQFKKCDDKCTYAACVSRTEVLRNDRLCVFDVVPRMRCTCVQRQRESAECMHDDTVMFWYMYWFVCICGACVWCGWLNGVRLPVCWDKRDKATVGVRHDERRSRRDCKWNPRVKANQQRSAWLVYTVVAAAAFVYLQHCLKEPARTSTTSTTMAKRQGWWSHSGDKYVGRIWAGLTLCVCLSIWDALCCVYVMPLRCVTYTCLHRGDIL